MNYLEPNFNPQDSKVSELRRILAENNVGYPSKAKKAILIKLFENSVKPKIGELRKNQNVRPSSDGIEKVRSKNGNISKTKSPKKKKRSREEEKDDNETISIDIVDVDGDIKMELSPRKSPSKSKKSNTSSDDGSKKKKRRKNHKKENENHKHIENNTPKSPEKLLVIEKFENDSSSSESLNTSFNKLPKGEKKEIFIPEEETKPILTSRRTIAPEVSKLIVSEDFKARLGEAMDAQESQNIPVESKSDEERISVDVKVEDGTEEPINTEEVQEEKVKTEEKEIQQEKIEPEEKEVKKETTKKSTKKCLKAALKFVSKGLYFSAVATAVLLSVWGREQKIQVGFCGKELPLKSVAGRFQDLKALKLVDQYLEKTFKPDCIPCPDNAVCSTELKMTCKDGFNYAESPFSLGGLVPIPGECILDDSEEKAFNQIIDYTMTYLRNKNTAVDCGNGKDSVLSGVSREELAEDVLDDIFEEFNLSKKVVNELWSKAIEKVKQFPEIENFHVKEDDSKDTDDVAPTEVEFFRSSSRKGLSLECFLQTDAKNFYFDNIRSIWGSAAALVMSFVTKRSWENKAREQAEIDNYVKKAAEILKKATETNQEIPFLHTLQLKEELLSDITDLNEKNLLWDSLIKKLEEDNTRISSHQAEIQGEIIKCWTWIGDLDQE